MNVWLQYLLVGMLWGCSNPFIKHAQAKQASIQHQSGTGTITTKESQRQHDHDHPDQDNDSNTTSESTIASIKRFLTNPAMCVPYLINQSGSLVFFLFVIPYQPITIAAPICNALSFIFTAITSYGYFHEELCSWQYLVLGIACVLFGSYICISSESQVELPLQPQS
jgi:drug/metabolite transporter (DMT)-like permease